MAWRLGATRRAYNGWMVERANERLEGARLARRAVELGKDDVVAPEASEEWVEALRKHDKVFEYKTYAIEPHGFLRRETQLDAWGRIERFLDWYLMPR